MSLRGPALTHPNKCAFHTCDDRRFVAFTIFNEMVSRVVQAEYDESQTKQACLVFI